MPEDIDLANPEPIRTAQKYRLSEGVLEAWVPLIDQNGNEIGRKSITVDLQSNHPPAVKAKVRQAIIDMAVYLGVIPAQP